MDINKAYESIMQRDMHVRKDTKHHNTLCCAPQCYSNCHELCQLDLLLDPSAIHSLCWVFCDNGEYGKLENCIECNHSWKDHRHYFHEWVVEKQDESIVDEEARQKFNAAQSETEKIAIKKEQIKQAIQTFEAELRQHEERLGQLCLQFQELALSGSFSGYLTSAIRMLDVRLAKMKSSGSDSDSIQRMEERIDSLRKQYKVVEKAKGTAQSPRNTGGNSSSSGSGPPSSGGRGVWGKFFGT
jgi:hypothetical protein